MLLITVREPGGLPVSHRFESDRISVGRASANDLRLKDDSVSRHHLEIRREGGERWVVRDLKSANGTRHNGSPLHEYVPLSSGDEIQTGDTLLVVELRPAAGEAPGSERATKRSSRDSRDPSDAALVGRSEAICRVREAVERVARSSTTVLITGPSGAGKELVARLIHERSPRSDGPFVGINCPALPGALIESELFGVEKGVATGVEERVGRFELAAGGTVLLDEVGDLSSEAQAKVLRVIEEKRIERIGGRTPLAIDVRILACTNHDLEADIEQGRFRLDLFHRLNTVHLTVPSLAERCEDIPLLVEHFLERAEGPVRAMSPEALELLERYHYPGNVRELKSIVEHAVLFAAGTVIQPADLPEAVGRTTARETDAGPDLADLLYRRIVEEGASFWDEVRGPFLRRDLARETVVAVVERARVEGGGSLKAASRVLGVEAQYKRLVNFLQTHELRARD